MFFFVWSMFVIGLALLFVPFLYNPNALQLTTLRRDYTLWAAWVAADGGAAGGAVTASWAAWWERGTRASADYDEAALILALFSAAVHSLGLRSLGPRLLGLRSLGARSLGLRSVGLRSLWPRVLGLHLEYYGAT